MKVSLGEFELKDFEKPDIIPLGGEQSLAEREFPGGNKSIQDMGPTYRPISWSGIFIGQDAYDRMMTIGLMRTAGKPIKFSTDKFSMDVMIKDFLPDYKSDRRIPFSITLTKVIDNNAVVSQPADSVDRVAVDIKSQATEVKQQEYVVKSGDTLSRVAAQIYGDPNKWENIYQDNQSVLKNGPHRIVSGMKLVIKNA